MKKLLLATALVASATAFADAPTALNAISFEGYAAGNGLGANGVAEPNEDGQSDKGAAYFCYDGEQDGLTVKAFGGENAAAPSITRPLYFASASPNAKYLDLSTEGGVLWRSIAAVTGSGANCELGSDQTISSDGLYLDTLVQFTPTEDGGTPDLDENNDKLAIWLNVDSTTTPPTTNLMVRASYVDDNGTATSATPTNFTLVTASPIVAGQWYRLTVKAIPDVTKCNARAPELYSTGYTGFEIYLDGVQLASSTSAFATGYLDLATATEFAWLDPTADADFVTYLESGKVFPSLLGDTSDSTLAAVGFKGSGALDDIVWTTEDPFANSPTPTGYSVEIGGSPVPITLSAEEVTALGDARFAAGITGTDLTTTAGVNAALATTIGSTGIPAWQAFFLGLPLTEAGLESFKITSIGFNEDGAVLVTLPASVTLLTGHGVNIVLSLQGSDDLSTWDALENATVTNNKPSFAAVEPGANETKKFYKVVVSFVQTPVVE